MGNTLTHESFHTIEFIEPILAREHLKSYQ